MSESTSVFEIVDSTSDEQYWSLGIFQSLSAAMAALGDCNPDNIPGDHEYYEGECRIEIRERQLGWSGIGKPVHVRRWVQEYNEAKDEYVWVFALDAAGGERDER